jgi:hypothetical protein
MIEKFSIRLSDEYRRARYAVEYGSDYGDRRSKPYNFRQGRPGQPWFNHPFQPDYDYERERDLRTKPDRWQDQENRQRQREEIRRRRAALAHRHSESNRRIPGPYEGLGPVGYRRSNENILEDICERLTMHGQVDASRFRVEVDDGVVRLEGEAPDRWTKRQVEDLASSVPGVFRIENHLRLR